MAGFVGWCGWVNDLAGQALRDVAQVEMVAYCTPRELTQAITPAAFDTQVGCCTPGIEAKTITDASVDYAGLTVSYETANATELAALQAEFERVYADGETGGGQSPAPACQ